jgi:hypothetical protein
MINTVLRRANPLRRRLLFSAAEKIHIGRFRVDMNPK